jgi:hypothetical protein
MAAETGAAIGGWKLLSLIGVGAIGAVVMAAVEPPKSRRALFAQALAAGVMAPIFTPAAVRALSSAGFVDLAGAGIERWGEVALPVGFLIGSLSWGFVGALVKIRAMLPDRGADAVARRVGLDAREEPHA